MTDARLGEICGLARRAAPSGNALAARIAAWMDRPRVADATSLAAGTLMPLAFAPWELWPLIYPSLALLFWFWVRGTPLSAARRGWLFGFGMFGFGVSWIHVSIAAYGNLPAPVAWVLAFALAAFLALFPAGAGALAACLAARLAARRRSPALLFCTLPCLWVLCELLRARAFTGFPWLSLGYSQLDTPLSGYVPVLGIYGLGGLAAASASLLTWWAIRYRTFLRAANLSLPLGALLWGGGALLRPVAWTEALPSSFDAAVIQGNVPQELKVLAAADPPRYLDPVLQAYSDQAEPHWGADLMVWPESAVPTVASFAHDWLETLSVRARQSGTELLIGALVWEREPDNRIYNALLRLPSEGSGHSYYKRHLVPFGEFLPFRDWLEPLFVRLGIPYSDLEPHEGDVPLVRTVAGFAGASICYEILFGDEIRKTLPQARFLVNVSNDGWFGRSMSAHQHLQIARARALETGRYLLRSTNGGASAVIDEKGRLVNELRPFQSHTITAPVRLFQGATPYVRWGDWPVLALSGLLVLATFLRRAPTPVR